MSPWPPAVKVCGLIRPQDAAAAAEAGARYLGIILAPGGRRTVAPGDGAYACPSNTMSVAGLTNAI